MNLAVLEHHLRKDGYSEEWIERIITALKHEDLLDEYRKEL